MKLDKLRPHISFILCCKHNVYFIKWSKLSVILDVFNISLVVFVKILLFDHQLNKRLHSLFTRRPAIKNILFDGTDIPGIAMLSRICRESCTPENTIQGDCYGELVLTAYFSYLITEIRSNKRFFALL